MKNIIITGAKGNLGSAVVKLFLEKNYNVIACISERSHELEIKNPNLESFSLDLTNSDACKVFSETIIKQYKTIDAAVLTVGGFAAGNIEVVSKTDFEKMFALNFITAFNIVQPVFKQLKIQTKGGKIILIG
ncbi:MAG: SDR family NAD(P)-dependent oxidoreductase, partial [Bacteroidota bacterium]